MRRHERWKLAFDGARCTRCQHGPPAAAARVQSRAARSTRWRAERFADRGCKVATYTLDHLAYSLQPPVVAAVVDFEGGGRFTCELTDVEPDVGRDRQRARDDLPPPVHGSGRPQLLLEGAPQALASAEGARSEAQPSEVREDPSRRKDTNGLQRNPGPRRDRRHGLHAVRRALGQGRGRSARRRRKEAYASAGVEPDAVDAYWLGTMGSGISGLMLSEALKIQYKPVTRLENMCATGSEALRNAAYAVASGAYDLVMAIGVEKLKDSGYSGLVSSRPPDDGTLPSMTAPAMFSLLAPAYAKKYGVDEGTLKDVISRIAWKNHVNGAKNPKAQFRAEVPIEKIKSSPRVAGMFGVFDCSGVSDGSAAAVICRAEDAHKYTDKPIFIKALAFAAGPGRGLLQPGRTTSPRSRRSWRAARTPTSRPASVNPREEISMAEVHDCFTATELVLMEDMGFSARGQAWKDVLEGRFDGNGPQPVNPDGGLKSFGHPIGASGLRMMYEMWLQLRGEAGARQIRDPKLGLTHNLGGQPGRCVSFVSVVGRVSAGAAPGCAASRGGSLKPSDGPDRSADHAFPCVVPNELAIARARRPPRICTGFLVGRRRRRGAGAPRRHRQSGRGAGAPARARDGGLRARRSGPGAARGSATHEAGRRARGPRAGRASARRAPARRRARRRRRSSWRGSASRSHARRRGSPG